MNRSALTFSERKIAAISDIDLGAGYPFGLAPEWTALRWHADLPERMIKAEDAVRRMFGLDQDIEVVATFSGSVALQRSLLAARSFLAPRGHPVVVLTTSPTIDIIPAIAREIATGDPLRLFCGLLRAFSDFEGESLCTMIREQAARDRAVIVVITSPENPTGAIWSAAQLRRIAQTCHATEAVLIVDHCFLLAGVHDSNAVVPIWSLSNDLEPVIAVWDTGKTIHLNGSKLGFILTRHHELAAHIDDALSIIQYTVPLHLSHWISAILQDPRFVDVTNGLRAAARQNQELLRDATRARGVEMLDSRAGSFDLVKIEHEIAQVGTVPLAHFEADQSRSQAWRRIALARPTHLFAAAIGRLLG